MRNEILFILSSVSLHMGNIFLDDQCGIAIVLVLHACLLHGEHVFMYASCQAHVKCYWARIHYLCLLLLPQSIQYFWRPLNHIYP